MSELGLFATDDGHILVSLPGAQALFTTRRGGVSAGPYESLNLGLTDPAQDPGDNPDAIAENRRRVAARAGVDASRLLIRRQVHGGHVDVGAASDDPADGIATTDRGVALAALVADCLPIAIAGEGAATIVHAGWRGLAAGVVPAGVAALRELGAAEPYVAAIGPGAGPCCYETGDDVRAEFAGDFPDAVGGRALDLKLIAQRQLREAGVAAVADVGLCTICSDPSLFFSHRRDNGVTGRQAGVVWRT
jgi:YfiH family protein